jgi:phosphoserine phosphatase
VKIVLVRHGQTDWNKKELFRGRADIPLNQVGIQQATKTAHHLKILDFSINKVYSSPLQRALQTAQAIANQLDIPPVEEVEDFIEFDYGQWEGQPYDTIKKKSPQMYKQWLNDPIQLKIPGGETLEQVKDRVKRALDLIMRQSKDQNIVIVSHKAITKIIIGILLGWEEDNYWKIEKDLASISIIEIDNGKVTAHVLNDIGHLLRE